MNDACENKVVIEPLLVNQETMAMMIGLNQRLIVRLKSKGLLPGFPEPIRISKKIILYRTKDIHDFVKNLQSVEEAVK